MIWFLEGLSFSVVGFFVSVFFSYLYLKRRERIDLSALKIFNEFTTLGLIYLFSWMLNSLFFYLIVVVLAVLFFLGKSVRFLMSINEQYRIMFLSFGYNDKEFSLYQIRKKLFKSFVRPALKFFGLYIVFSSADLKNPFVISILLVLGVTIGLLNGVDKFD
ncbi:hypothetical protein THMA_0889 [Thermotoga maritima MSB8]|uniref:Uncharacterized protein n=1 Tax=Thermotoga maritima (strain ATCC 43589 / DSM 3109 / JCM 10099 / NBRC 100826 / MSB8) TaxID=243274 RepID=Q9WZX1_THEMA|nr:MULTISPECIES: hypothetical protein [Thermotoga]AAD35949.1 hypothetical protein TM_0867 [Thermotoga maritima MSB8]AGL49794.1 hypothetical protein Tmari_0869 [Thermotoga maritima MSB8]AHD17380.1 hypothetical protein THEMA_00300 [Thermotoga maritima MSB8]AIY85612.1 hypothetical protein T2812B_00305 [Thermotoga sp. 2812B]AKE26781.1 hypothetical protein THMC_0889 [Thermotoga maritima]